MAAIAEAAPGSTVVDCPCGAGPAFRALAPDTDVRYVAVDPGGTRAWFLSDGMCP